MSNLNQAAMFLLVGLVGCASPGGGGGGGDDTGGGDDGGGEAPPFTNGVSTLSGHSNAGYIDGARGTARFANPVNVISGPSGKLYVADFDNNKVRVVNAETGQTSTLVAQDGFKRPFAMAFGNDANTLYVSTDNDDTGGHNLMSGTIWRVDIAAKTATVIVARIGRPRGLAVLADGRLAVSDYMHHVIQLVDPATGALSPLAGAWDAKGMVDGGSGAAKFSTPYGLAVIPGSDDLVVADFDNHRLRIVGLDGSVSTLAGASTAGFADGSMSSALFHNPQGIAVTSSGDVYVTDLGNYRIRRLSGDNVETVAGSGEGGYLDSDDRMAAQFIGLEGMSATADGSMLFVADGNRGEDLPHNFVRSIKMN